MMVDMWKLEYENTDSTTGVKQTWLPLAYAPHSKVCV